MADADAPSEPPVDPDEQDPTTAQWIAEIDASEKWAKTFYERGRQIVQRYRNERRLNENVPKDDDKRFAILWSNVQTLGPAIYAKPPEPVVSRRFRDSDPVGRYASEVLERALLYTTCHYNFDERIKSCRDDYLVPGRGQMWIRYVPHEAEKADDVQITQEIEDGGGPNQGDPTYAEVCFDHVAYDDFGHTPAREWAEVWYVWRRVFMDRQELVARFGRKIGRKVPLDWAPKDDDGDTRRRERAKKAAVYELWDKRRREVLWISKQYGASPLDRRADWLRLSEFFPCPRPLCATLAQDKFLPIADFIYYQDQAIELDELTQKIGRLIDGIKVSGFYAGKANIQLQNLFQSEINQLVAIDAFGEFTERGGMKSLIEWFPIEPVTNALKVAFETRARIVDDIYQITGISDIMRGATDPDETAAAQGLKSQWGSLRVRDRQAAIATFSRDIMKIAGEIIAEHFPAPVLAAMTDVQLPTMAQKQAAQMLQRQAAQMQQQRQALEQQHAQQTQQAQGAGQAPPPPLPPFQPPQMPADLPPPEVLQRPSWEEVQALLKDDQLRSFRIDIETDSTIQVDEDAEKRRRVEFITALGTLIGQATAAVTAAPQLAPLIGKAVEFLARGFRAGREMEDIIEQTFESIAKMPPQQPQGAQQGMSQAEQQLTAQENALKAQELQAKVMDTNVNAQAEQQRTASQHALGLMDAQLRGAELQQNGQQMVLDQQARQQQAAQQQQPPLVIQGGRR